MSDYSNTFRDGERVKLPAQSEARAMKRYRVTVREIVTYQVDVEAEDESDAEEIAIESIVQNGDRDEWCSGVEDRDVIAVFENPPNWDGAAKHCARCHEPGSDFGEAGLCLECFKLTERGAAS